MVIGNGLMAKAFKKFADEDSVVIFASGVSNSAETSIKAYERERILLEKWMSWEGKLIYFSTCSVGDESLQHTRYVQHKLAMEDLIKREKDSYLILRLPVVVGRSENTHTLTNFFYINIIKQNPFQIYSRSCRYLIDAEDVVDIISLLLKKKNYVNEIINIALDNRIRVIELVGLLEQVISVKAKYEIIDRGACYTIDNSRIKELVSEFNFNASDKYNFFLLQKYYSAVKPEILTEKVNK